MFSILLFSDKLQDWTYLRDGKVAHGDMDGSIRYFDCEVEAVQAVVKFRDIYRKTFSDYQVVGLLVGLASDR